MDPSQNLPAALMNDVRETNDKLNEALINYREAVVTSSPGLPPRLPWVLDLIRRNPDGVVSSFVTHTQRSRRAATLGWWSQPLRGISPTSH